MQQYCLTKLDTKDHSTLISLLDYKKHVSEQLATFSFEQEIGKKVLVDTALISGINDYRFVSLTVLEDGTLDFHNTKYLVPTDDVVEIANKTLSNHKEYVEHSVLPAIQIDALLN